VLVDLIAAQNLTVMQADVKTPELPFNAYDLVSYRALLHQIADHAPQVLEKMAAAVRPGGWPLVQEPDFHLADHREGMGGDLECADPLVTGQQRGSADRATAAWNGQQARGRPRAKTDVQNIRGAHRGALFFQLFFAEVRERVLESGLIDAATFRCCGGSVEGSGVLDAVLDDDRGVGSKTGV
jgi:hypothetical protein